MAYIVVPPGDNIRINFSHSAPQKIASAPGLIVCAPGHLNLDTLDTRQDIALLPWW